MLAQAIALFFLLYYLRDRIGYDPELGVLILSRASPVACRHRRVVRLVLRQARRAQALHPLSATGVAAACAVLAFTSSFTMVVVGAVILGLSWGVYQAIDQASSTPCSPPNRSAPPTWD